MHISNRLFIYRFYVNPLVARSVVGKASNGGSSNASLHPSASTIDSMKDGDNDEGLLTDDYILHFYDLSILKPHFCYHFVKVK